MPRKDDIGSLKPIKPKQSQSLAGFKPAQKAEPLDIFKEDTAPKKPKSQTKPKGRAKKPPKPAKERESEMLGLMLTPTEKAALAEKAGLVGVSTFLKHYLRTETNLLKK